MLKKNLAKDWIRTADLCYWKQPLYQLSHHNHCPTEIKFQKPFDSIHSFCDLRRGVKRKNLLLKNMSTLVKYFENNKGYGRRLILRRLWVRILAPYTGWTFFTHLFVVKTVMFVWKHENKWKRGRGWPRLKKSWFKTVIHYYVVQTPYLFSWFRISPISGFPDSSNTTAKILLNGSIYWSISTDQEALS